MIPRALGRSGVELSPICFGSMRLHERGLSDDAWLALLRGGIERGVTTIHASNEYEAHPRLLDLLGKLRAPGLQFIVKLAEPHFPQPGDTGPIRFDRARLIAKVDAYLAELRAPRLDVVQYMWRGDMKDEPGRLRAFSAAVPDIADAFAQLRAAGKVGAVAPFPYTTGFADAALAATCFDGLTVYFNPLERDMLGQIEAAAAAGLGIVALRPLFAGKALAGSSPAECVRSVLAQPGVTTTVVSYSSLAHLDDLLT
jgi:aryl-alcohol dehydrogenase-like predicted oxidoreductase